MDEFKHIPRQFDTALSPDSLISAVKTNQFHGIHTLDTAESLADFLRLSVACIRKWTRTTDIPHLRCGRAVRFDRMEVLAWLKGRA
jgi:excisionase family DNA binding protein